MTLRERRDELQATLQEALRQLESIREATSATTMRINHLQGAIAFADELLREGEDDAVSEQGATALHGDEIRAGEGVKERKGQHGRVHDDHKAAP